MPNYVGGDVQESQIGNTATHVNALGTTTVKSGAGVLYSVIINTKGAGSNTATLYDGLSAAGTVIAIIDTTGAAGELRYGLRFTTGLTVVLAVGTAADLTIVTG